MKTLPTIEDINAILPQTQCRDCDYDGCKPYAEAIVNHGESIDRCPPGGVTGLKKLAELTGQTLTDDMISTLHEKEKPRQVVKVREAICIGCKKCIDACPIDAIVGAAKQMHVIISDQCNGCELCIPPCPMDCIDIMPLSEHKPFTKAESGDFRTRYEARETRLDRVQKEKREKHLKAKTQRDAFIQAALARAKKK